MKAKKIDYKNAASKLASCVIFALKFLKTTSGGAMYDPKTGELKRWQDDFMDALDMVGYEVDREKYFADRAGKKKRR